MPLELPTNSPWRNITADITDGLYHARDQISDDFSEEPLSPLAYQHVKTWLSLEEISAYDDGGGWLTAVPGWLRNAAPEKITQWARRFRPEAEFDQAVADTLQHGFAALIIMDTPEFTGLVDGRGRLNLAVALGVQELPVLLLRHKTMRKNPHRRDAASYAADEAVRSLANDVVSRTEAALKSNTKVQELLRSKKLKISFIEWGDDPGVYDVYVTLDLHSVAPDLFGAGSRLKKRPNLELNLTSNAGIYNAGGTFGGQKFNYVSNVTLNEFFPPTKSANVDAFLRHTFGSFFRFNPQSRSVFIHELIHYFDWVRYGDRDSNKGAADETARKEHTEEYYSTAMEFNAHFQAHWTDFAAVEFDALANYLKTGRAKPNLKYVNFSPTTWWYGWRPIMNTPNLVNMWGSTEFYKKSVGKYRNKLLSRLYMSFKAHHAKVRSILKGAGKTYKDFYQASLREHR